MGSITGSGVRRGTGHALWASTALDTRGGVASYVRTLADTPLHARWSVRHVTTHRDGSTLFKALAFARGLLGYLTALILRRPDVVHLHMASYGSFARKATLAVLARAVRVPVVLHVHGGEFHLFYDRAPRLLQAAIRSTLEHAAVVVALGGQWAERLQRIAPAANIAVVPNAVAPVGSAVQPVDGSPVQVVCLGEVRDGKGTFFLLDAWAKVVVAASSPIQLVLAGDGELERARAQIDALGLGDTVTMCGWLSRAEVTALLGSAQVLTLPSLAEGQPMAVLEAMARGLCVVASDVGGIPDLVGDDAGMLVPPGDVDALAAALTRAVNDVDERVRLGEGGLARVRGTFDTAIVWRRIEDLYLQATERASVVR